MSLLQIHFPGESSPEMEEIYQNFIRAAGMVPPPVLLSSTSPDIQALQARISGYLREKSGLSPLFMALVRYLTAVALDMKPCIKFNARALELLGMTDEDVAQLKENPAAAPLDEKEGWLLAFVIKSLRAPETLAESHVTKLRQLGWTDKDIFDALYISCMLVGMDRMMKVLKFDE